MLEVLEQRRHANEGISAAAAAIGANAQPLRVLAHVRHMHAMEIRIAHG